MTQGEPEWQGELLLSQGWAHYRGPAGDTSFHSHYPVQLVFSKHMDVTVRFSETEVRTGRYIMVQSNEKHQLMPVRSTIDILYIDPALLRSQSLTPNKLKVWPAYHCCARPQIEDARLVRVLAELDSALDRKVALADAAKSAGMSKSAFTQKFRAVTGLPLRRYVLWRRLYLAVLAISEGLSATEAAHHAGFADSAHFSRTMRQTFGVSPSGSLQQIKMTAAPQCAAPAS